MTLETDLLLDRRRLKRRLFLWRVVALLAVVGALLLAVDRDGELKLSRDHVARLTLSGTITEDRKMVDALAALARDPTAKALLVVLDSPGGTVSGGESLHHAIARVGREMPVVAVMGATAASAGYMVALPAERIFWYRFFSCQAFSMPGSRLARLPRMGKGVSSKLRVFL